MYKRQLLVGVGGAISNNVVNDATLVFDRSGLTNFSGTISGAGSQTVIRSGTLALGPSGAIANSGTVIVGDAGSTGAMLDLASKSSYTFAAGQTLQGKGTINAGSESQSGTVTILGWLTPGNSPGELTFANADVVLGTTANTVMEINGAGPGTSYDVVTGTGVNSLTYGGTLTLDFGALFESGTFNLFNFDGIGGDFSAVVATGSYSGNFSSGTGGIWTLSSGGQTLRFDSFANGGTTGQLVIVPEPIMLGLLGIASGFGVLTVRRYRRRRAAGG